MSVIMQNKNIPNNDMKEAGTSCEGLLFGSLQMQGFQVSRGFKVLGGCNQATMNKTYLNADNEDNVMVLREEGWEDLFGNSMEITNFNEFACESSNEDDINISYNNKEKQTWTETLNTAAIMEYYFLSRPVDKEDKPVRR